MKKKVLLVGPLLTRSGYGEQSRFALRSLRSRPDLFEVFIKPLPWGKTSWIVDDTDERRWIDETIEKTIGYVQNGGQFDISVQVTIPNEFQPWAREKNIGYTAGIETTMPSHIWTEKCNEMDSVIVVSNHSKKVLETARFDGTEEQTGKKVVLENTTTFTTVNYPVKQFSELPDLNLEIDTSFNFLTVAQMGPRKDLNSTIQWFLQEFKDDDVGLVIKTNIAKNCLMDRRMCLGNLKSMVDQAAVPDRKCKVYLIHGNMTDEEMHSLYKNDKIGALVAIPHGEGYGLPIFEAAYSGLPVVSIGWSGQCDFLYDKNNKPHFYEVAYDIRPVPESAVWDGVIVKESGWAYAREDSTKEQMRRCYEDIVQGNEESIAANSYERSQQLIEDFSEEKLYAQFVSCVFNEVELKEKEEEVEELLNDLL